MSYVTELIIFSQIQIETISIGLKLANKVKIHYFLRLSRVTLLVTSRDKLREIGTRISHNN